MNKVIFSLLFISNLALAQEIGTIDMNKNLTNQTTVTFEQSDNVTVTCNNYRKKFGNPTFQQPSLACSFWTNNTCLVITARKISPDTLAHEILHCIQGRWH